MKHISIPFLFLIIGLQCSAQPLHTFKELLAALKEGREVRVVISYAQCRLVIDSAETKSPEAIGGMTLSPFEYFAPMSINNPKAFITSSQTVLISHAKRGHVYNYVKLKIFDDNSVEITARYLHPSTFEILMDEKFHCTIAQAEEASGVRLFAR